MRSFYPLVFVFGSVLIGAAYAQQPQQSKQTAAVATSATTPQPGNVDGSAKVSSASNSLPADDKMGLSHDDMPITVKLNAATKKQESNDPILDVPPLPGGKTTLVGGTVGKIDGVRNKMTVKVFGGGEWDVAFDERTHIFLNGVETTFDSVKKGARVYVDTMADGHYVLARNIRVLTNSGPADARGQIMEVGHGTVTIRDTLSAMDATFQVADSTQVKRYGRPASLRDLRAGSLVAVEFSPTKENWGAAREIAILAVPGESFRFSGTVTHLDLSLGTLAVANHIDNKTYEITFDRKTRIPTNLKVGSDVIVAAVFDGKQYELNEINVTERAAR